MSEEELNIQYVCNKTLLDNNDELVPSEQYIKGLEQGKFDAMMNKLGLLNWLESKNKIILQQHKIVEPVIKVQDVIDKIKEDL